MNEEDQFPAEPLDSKREEFEQGIKKLAVETLGYSNSDAMLKTLLERSAKGRYIVDWVYGAWLGFNMAHAPATQSYARLSGTRDCP